jgi:hypothetical protein
MKPAREARHLFLCIWGGEATAKLRHTFRSQNPSCGERKSSPATRFSCVYAMVTTRFPCHGSIRGTHARERHVQPSAALRYTTMHPGCVQYHPSRSPHYLPIYRAALACAALPSISAYIWLSSESKPPRVSAMAVSIESRRSRSPLSSSSSRRPRSSSHSPASW